MATSLSMSNENISSKASSPHELDEYTSLLGSNHDNDATWTPTVLSASQPLEQDALRSIDEVSTGAFESTHGKTDPKPATGIIGIISVLLLGMISPRCFLWWGGPLCSHSWAEYRLFHCKRRHLDCPRNIQYDLVRTR